MGCAPDSAVLRDLRERLRSLERASRPAGAAVRSTGFAAVDRLLPARGLEAGTLVEWLSDDEGAGTVALSLAVAAHLARGAGAVVVLDGPHDFYPPAAARLGVPLEHTVVLRPDGPADA